MVFSTSHPRQIFENPSAASFRLAAGLVPHALMHLASHRFDDCILNSINEIVKMALVGTSAVPEMRHLAV
jgi:hypothetical protein